MSAGGGGKDESGYAKRKEDASGVSAELMDSRMTFSDKQVVKEIKRCV